MDRGRRAGKSEVKAVGDLRLAVEFPTRIFCRNFNLRNHCDPRSLTVPIKFLFLAFVFNCSSFHTMAGGGGKYRHLGRKSSHRQALLRNLVTSLFENESITTTWAKAKEAQRLADKLITLGKKNSEASRRRALEIFYVRLTHPNHPPYIFDPGRYSFQGRYMNHRLTSRSETPFHHPQTLRAPPRTLPRTPRRLHACTPSRT